MTNRIKSLTVVLENDIRDDDIESLTQAIKLLRNVLVVKLNVANPEDYEARSRIKAELQKKLWDVISKD